MNVTLEHFLSLLVPKDSNQTIVLTANLRQSRQLDQLMHQNDAAHPVSKAQPIAAINTWLESLRDHLLLNKRFSKHILNKKLCSSFESQLIWNRTIASSENIPSLVNKNDFIRQIQSAYDICSGYLIDDATLLADATPETELFLQIKKHYLNELEKHSLIDIYQFLSMLVSSGNGLVIDQVILYGFSELTPLYRKVLETVCVKELIFVDIQNENSDTSLYTCDTEEEEITHAATWAKQKIQLLDSQQAHGGAENNSGEIPIAIVVPDLASKKHKIERSLFKHLEPELYISKKASLIPNLFDISAGDALDSAHIIKSACLLPQLAQNKLSTTNLKYLFASPYWGEGVSAWRHNIIAKMARLPEGYVNLYQILPEQSSTDPRELDLKGQPQTHSARHEQTSLSQLEKENGEHEILTRIRREKTALAKNRMPSVWVEYFKSLLKTAKFPGPSPLSSYEYQIVKRFFSALDEIESLDAIFTAPIRFEKFEEILKLKLTAEVFHPEVKQPKVHVLGLMEAAGLRFQHCLVMGLTESTLPQPAKPHPFIPVSLQRERQTPRSSPERELDYANRFFDALVSGSKNITLGYAKEIDSQVASPSPLLSPYQKANTQPSLSQNLEIRKKSTFSKLLQAAISFDKYDYIKLGNAPVIPKQSRIRGGAYLLDLHWVNPLFAFFKYRLGVDKSETLDIGLNARVRGTLIHALLHGLYSKFSNRQAIQTFVDSDDHLMKIQQEAKSLMLSSGGDIKYLSELNFAYELEHIAKVALHSLNFDANRNEDFKIETLEKEYEVYINNRVFSTRIDRIDNIDSNLIVIDFKTGKSALTGLLKNPITDHQLPFYASAINYGVSAVAYMETQPNKAILHGIRDPDVSMSEFTAIDKSKSSELPKTWSAATDVWRSCITDRVSEIVAGQVHYQARVRSKQSFYNHYLAAVRPEEIEPNHDDD